MLTNTYLHNTHRLFQQAVWVVRVSEVVPAGVTPSIRVVESPQLLTPSGIRGQGAAVGGFEVDRQLSVRVL